MRVTLIQAQLIFVVVIIYLSFQLVDGELLRDQNQRQFRQIKRSDQMELKKRPFCNAFSGCGRKRSDSITLESKHSSENVSPDLQNRQLDDDNILLDDSIGSLLDLNSEPAVEGLMRQIMSEAKLWEAIQEANREVNIQKLGNNKPKNDHYNIAFSSQR